jgi:hypothetical protein
MKGLKVATGKRPSYILRALFWWASTVVRERERSQLHLLSRRSVALTSTWSAGVTAVGNRVAQRRSIGSSLVSLSLPTLDTAPFVETWLGDLRG